MKPIKNRTRGAQYSRLFELIRQQEHADQIADHLGKTLTFPTLAHRLFALQAGETLIDQSR